MTNNFQPGDIVKFGIKLLSPYDDYPITNIVYGEISSFELLTKLETEKFYVDYFEAKLSGTSFPIVCFLYKLEKENNSKAEKLTAKSNLLTLHKTMPDFTDRIINISTKEERFCVVMELNKYRMLSCRFEEIIEYRQFYIIDKHILTRTEIKKEVLTEFENYQYKRYFLDQDKVLEETDIFEIGEDDQNIIQQ